MSVKPFEKIKSADTLNSTGYVYQALNHLDTALKTFEAPDCEGDQIKNLAAWNVRKSSLNAGNLIIEVNKLENGGEIRGTVPVFWRNNAGILELTTDPDNGPWTEIGSANLQPWQDVALNVQNGMYDAAAASLTLAEPANIFTGGPVTIWCLLQFNWADGQEDATNLLLHRKDADAVIVRMGVGADWESYRMLFLECPAGTLTSDAIVGSPKPTDRFVECGVCIDPGVGYYWFFNGIVESLKTDVIPAAGSWQGTVEQIMVGYAYPEAQLQGTGQPFTLGAIGVFPGLMYTAGTRHFPGVTKPHAPHALEYWHFREDDDATVLHDAGPNGYDLTLNTDKASLEVVNL